MIKNGSRSVISSECWKAYTDDNEHNIAWGASDFIYELCTKLKAKKVLEVGCNVGHNFYSFPTNFDCTGVDVNVYALKKARNRLPYFSFEERSIYNLTFPDNWFDVVFTRAVMVHIPNTFICRAMGELLRVTKKWIFHMEYHGTNGVPIPWKRGTGLLWYRNMAQSWGRFPVEVIEDRKLTETEDQEDSWFTLIRK